MGFSVVSPFGYTKMLFWTNFETSINNSLNVDKTSATKI